MKRWTGPEHSTSKRGAHIHSFEPVHAPDARVLILGTMPGVLSLHKCEYYAHPRNLFWRIMAHVLKFDPEDSYEDRVSALKGSRVAVWDVLKWCTRESSLDSDIDTSTMAPNAFEPFYAAHPQLKLVCFNGTKAAAIYRRSVRRPSEDDPFRYVTLPSTSPANTRIPFAAKLAAWKVVGDVASAR